MKPDFSVTILCKPYVKHYLTQNFGDPVDLYHCHNSLLPFLRLLLEQKTIYRQDKRALQTKCYSDPTTIILSEDDFMRSGFELSRTHIIMFNREVEAKLKYFMHSIVAINFTLTGNLCEAIEMFTNDFDIPEDIWPHESIRKDFCRHASFHKFDFKATISQTLTTVLLEQLSEFGTITQTTIKEYEHNSKRKNKPRWNSKSLGYSILFSGHPEPTKST